MLYEDLLKNRRAVRDFKDDAVPMSTIKEILHDACIAPSARNLQPWRFIVVTDKNLMKRLSDDAKKNLLAEVIKSTNPNMRDFAERLRDPNFNVFYNAPCLILIVGDKNSPWFMKDCSMCAVYLMLAATERGLGTCWIGLGEKIKDPELCKAIGLTDEYEIVAPLILGVPKMLQTEYTRNEPIILNK
jgi:nitroreductase